MPSVRMSVSPSATSPVARHVKLSTVVKALRGEYDLCGIREKTRAYRSHPSDQLKRALPCLHAGGRFALGQMAAEDTCERVTDLCTIDIDHRADHSEIPQKDIRRLFGKMKTDPYIRMIAPSVRGWLWAIIRLSGDRASAFLRARRYFKIKYNIDIGSQGDIRRARFLAIAPSEKRFIAIRTIDNVRVFGGRKNADIDKPEPHGDPLDSVGAILPDIDLKQASCVLAYVDPFCDMVEWVKRLGAIKAQFGEDGKALANTWSRGTLRNAGVPKGHSHYEAARFETAWRSLRRTGGATFKSILACAQENGYSARAEAYSKAAKQEIKAGRDKEWIAKINGDLHFIHLPTRSEQSRETFDAAMAIHFLGEKAKRQGKTRGVVRPSELYLNVLDVPRVAGDTYRPGQGPIVVEGSTRCHNLWRESGAEPICESDWSDHERLDVRRVRRHLDWMLGADKAKIIKSYLAMVVQRRERVRWCPILVGPEGCGKSMIGEMMKHILGRDNAVPVYGDQIGGNSFNSFAAGYEFVALEEVKAADWAKTREILDKLKPLITNDEVSWHRKGKDPISVPNTVQYLATTNHPDALQLGDGDRRWCVLSARYGRREEFLAELGGDAQASEYFSNLAAALKRSPGALRGWLLAKAVIPGIRSDSAPNTPDKKEMIQANKTDLERGIDRYLIRQIKKGIASHYGKPAIVVMHDLRSGLESFDDGASYDNISGRTIGSILRGQGYISLGDSLRINGKNNQNVFAQRSYIKNGETKMETYTRAIAGKDTK